jgi:hypothetical protein
MILQQRIFSTLALAALVLCGGCATTAPKDYSAFLQARPASILVLPPENLSPDVAATPALLAQMTRPLAESGYYVIPVALMNATFQENGVHNAAEAQAIPPAKLREIFGADAVLYTKITEYGARYQVVSSEVAVAAQARLVDLRTGTELWNGAARSSSNENRNNSSGGGLAGLLVQAVLEQVVNSLVDNSYQYAGLTSQRLLSAGGNGQMLPGPRRSPGKPTTP